VYRTTQKNIKARDDRKTVDEALQKGKIYQENRRKCPFKSYVDSLMEMEGWSGSTNFNSFLKEIVLLEKSAISIWRQ